jgi:hypothetical protein
MSLQHSRRSSLLALGIALTAGASILTGCGGGVSDKDQIVAVVKSEGTNPATLCRHLTSALLVRFGGKSACLRAGATAAKDPTTHATGVKVRGATATALVSDRSGSRTLKFIKRNGVWLVSGTQ